MCPFSIYFYALTVFFNFSGTPCDCHCSRDGRGGLNANRHGRTNDTFSPNVHEFQLKAFFLFDGGYSHISSSNLIDAIHAINNRGKLIFSHYLFSSEHIR